MNFTIKDTYNCDVLVAGSGLAGIRATYDLLKSGKNVIVVTSQTFCSGSSFSQFNSSLRFQLPLDDNDVADYAQSLIYSGKKMADDKMYKIISSEITKEIERLEDFNINVTYYKGRAACFAEKPRLLAQISDWKRIRNDVKNVFSKFKNSLTIIYGDIERLIKFENRVDGALVLNNKSDLIRVNSNFVILATGGYCGLYQHSLNTKDNCGIGHSIAMDVGCKMINMEFQQFIPALISPKKNLLFGEILLQYCTSIVDEEGKDLLSKYLPNNVTKKDCLLKRSSHGPFTSEYISSYFDICMMDKILKSKRMEGITLTFDSSILTSNNFMIKDNIEFYKSHGIDLSKDKIKIAPFAHCSNGGIKINEYGLTNIEGLLAAGECSGGIHGADRQGGVATATSIIFGSRTAKYINSFTTYEKINNGVNNKDILLDLNNWFNKGDGNCPLAESIIKELGERLWYSASIVRSEEITRPTYNWVTEILNSFNFDKQIEMGQNIKTIFKAFHSLRVAKVILYTILERKESRGGHYRLDYPNIDNENWDIRITV